MGLFTREEEMNVNCLFICGTDNLILSRSIIHPETPAFPV